MVGAVLTNTWTRLSREEALRELLEGAFMAPSSIKRKPRSG